MFNIPSFFGFRAGGEPPTPYQQVLNYATSQGYTLPSAGQQILQEQLLNDLINDGIWDKLDTFAVFATDAEDAPASGTSNFALIDWKKLSQMTAVNSPTFTTNQGFTGNGTSAYINTNFNPSLAVKMSANNSNMTIRMNTIVDTQNVAGFAGCFNISALQIVEFKQFDRVLNDNFGNNAGVPFVLSDGSKWFSTNRINSTEQVFFQNITSTTQSRTFFGIPNNNVALLGRLQDSTLALPSDRQISMFAAGESLISENTDFFNAWDSYYTSL